MNFKLFLFFLISPLFYIFTSCVTLSDSKFNHYEDNFISFSVPKDWVITEIDTTQDDIMMYTIEEALAVSSFGIYITLDNNESIQDMNHIQKNILKEQMPNAKIGRTKDSIINNENTLLFKYLYESKLKYKGTYIALECNQKAITINYQFSVDEEARVKEKTLELISTIHCK